MHAVITINIEQFRNLERYWNQSFSLCIIELPNAVADKWEEWHAGEVNQHRMALISDSFYLNHMFNKLALKYTNLYRSPSNQLVLPYFLPLSYKNLPEFNAALNHL